MILSTNAYTQVLTFWYVGGGNTGVGVRRSDGPQMSANTYSTVHTIIWAIQEKVSFSKTVEKLDFFILQLVENIIKQCFHPQLIWFCFFRALSKNDFFVGVCNNTYIYE